jgi:hypothetical protein
MAMKKRRETAEERRLRRMLVMAATATDAEGKRLRAFLEIERATRAADAAEAARILLEEKKRREEDVKSWNERLIAKDGWIVDLQKQHAARVDELDLARQEIGRLERVVLEMAKVIYVGEWDKG